MKPNVLWTHACLAQQQDQKSTLTLIRLGGGRSGVNVHEGLGAADVAERDLAQPLQLDIAHAV